MCSVEFSLKHALVVGPALQMASEELLQVYFLCSKKEDVYLDFDLEFWI